MRVPLLVGFAVVLVALVASGAQGADTTDIDLTFTPLGKDMQKACLKYMDDSTCEPCQKYAEAVTEFQGMQKHCVDEYEAMREAAGENPAKQKELAKSLIVCKMMGSSVSPSGSSPYYNDRGVLVTDKKACNNRNSKIRHRNNMEMRRSLLYIADRDIATNKQKYSVMNAEALNDELKDKIAANDNIFLEFCTSMKCCGDKTLFEDLRPIEALVPDKDEEENPLLQEEAAARAAALAQLLEKRRVEEEAAARVAEAAAAARRQQKEEEDRVERERQEETDRQEQARIEEEQRVAREKAEREAREREELENQRLEALRLQQEELARQQAAAKDAAAQEELRQHQEQLELERLAIEDEKRAEQRRQAELAEQERLRLEDEERARQEAAAAAQASEEDDEDEYSDAGDSDEEIEDQGDECPTMYYPEESGAEDDFSGNSSPSEDGSVAGADEQTLMGTLGQKIIKVEDEDSLAIGTITGVLRDVGRLFACAKSKNQYLQMTPEAERTMNLENVLYIVEGKPPAPEEVERRDDAPVKAVLKGLHSFAVLIDRTVAKYQADDKCSSYVKYLGGLKSESQLYKNVKTVLNDDYNASQDPEFVGAMDTLVSSLSDLYSSVTKAVTGWEASKKSCPQKASNIFSMQREKNYENLKLALITNLADAKAARKAALAVVAEQGDINGMLVLDNRYVDALSVDSDAATGALARQSFPALRRVVLMVKAALTLVSKTKPRVAHVLYMERKVDQLFAEEARLAKLMADPNADGAEVARRYNNFVSHLYKGGASGSAGGSDKSAGSSESDLIVMIWDAGSTKSAINMVLGRPIEGTPATLIVKGDSWPAGAPAGAAAPAAAALEAALDRKANSLEQLAAQVMDVQSGLPRPGYRGQLENTLDHDFKLSEKGMYSMPGLSSFLDCDRGCPENFGATRNWKSSAVTKWHPTADGWVTGPKDWSKGGLGVMTSELLMGFCPRPRCPNPDEFQNKVLGGEARSYGAICKARLGSRKMDAERRKALYGQCLNAEVAKHSSLGLSPANRTWQVLRQALGAGSRRLGKPQVNVCETFTTAMNRKHDMMTLPGYVAMTLDVMATKSALAKAAEGVGAATEEVLVVSTAGMRIGQSYCPERAASKIHEFQGLLAKYTPDTMQSRGYIMQNGKVEALNGWITSNFLTKLMAVSRAAQASGDYVTSISKLEKAQMPNIIPEADDLFTDSVVHVELGGGSAQIAFTVPADEWAATRTAMNEYDQEFLVDHAADTRQELPLYRFSLLYYGAEYAKYSQEKWADQASRTTYCYQPALNLRAQATALAPLWTAFKGRMGDTCASTCASVTNFSAATTKAYKHCCAMPAGSVAPGSVSRQENVDTTVTAPAERLGRCYSEIVNEVVRVCKEQQVPVREYNDPAAVKVYPRMIKSDKTQRPVMIAGGGMYYPMVGIIRVFLCSNLALEGESTRNPEWRTYYDDLYASHCLGSDADAGTTAAVQAILAAVPDVSSAGMDEGIAAVVSDYVHNVLMMRAELGDFADQLHDYTRPVVSVPINVMKKMTETLCASNELFSAAFLLGNPAMNIQLSSMCFSNTFNMYMLHTVFGVRYSAESAAAGVEVNTGDLAGEDEAAVMASLAANEAVVMFSMGVLRQKDPAAEGPKWYPNRWSIGAAARHLNSLPMASEKALAIEAIDDPESDTVKNVMLMRISHKASTFAAVYGEAVGNDMTGVLGGAFQSNLAAAASKEEESEAEADAVSEEAVVEGPVTPAAAEVDAAAAAKGVKPKAVSRIPVPSGKGAHGTPGLRGNGATPSRIPVPRAGARHN